MKYPVFIKDVGSKNNRRMWKVLCPVCELPYITSATSVRNKKSTKCRSCSNKITSTSHGFTKTKIHMAWLNMKSRCRDESYPSYHRYGGRGIKVCEEWKNDFVCFKNWAFENGYNIGLELDRKENDGNYEPSNCRWVTHKVNASNRNLKNMIGEKFGKLLIIEENDYIIDKNNRKKRFFICKCDCGALREVSLSNILGQKDKKDIPCRCHHIKKDMS